MIHGTLHLPYGDYGLTAEGHQALDNEAKDLLNYGGLGRGGCSGQTNWLGIPVIGGLTGC